MKAEEALWNILRGKCIPYKKASKNKLAEVVKENADLKGLLKLIYDEMQEEKRCWTCEYKKSSGADRICYKCSYSEKTMYKWKHADEAEKLLEK